MSKKRNKNKGKENNKSKTKVKEKLATVAEDTVKEKTEETVEKEVEKEIPKICLKTYGDDKDLDVKYSFKKFYITELAYKKMMGYTQAVDGEVGGLLVVDETTDDVIISDITLPEQEISTGSVELDQNDMGKFMEDALKNNRELLPRLKGWWHSHAEMGTFWSGTDDTQFQHMLDYYTSKKVYGIVVNKKQDLILRVDMQTPLGAITFDKIPVDIIANKDNNQQFKEETDLKVKKKYSGVTVYKSSKHLFAQTRFFDRNGNIYDMNRHPTDPRYLDKEEYHRAYSDDDYDEEECEKFFTQQEKEFMASKKKEERKLREMKYGSFEENYREWSHEFLFNGSNVFFDFTIGDEFR